MTSFFWKKLSREKYEDYKFDKLPLWVQIHDLPIDLLSPSIVCNMLSNYGSIVPIDPLAATTWKSFARVKLIFNPHFKLKSDIIANLDMGKSVMGHIKFEHLRRFCNVCYELGHEALTCVTRNKVFKAASTCTSPSLKEYLLDSIQAKLPPTIMVTSAGLRNLDGRSIGTTSTLHSKHLANTRESPNVSQQVWISSSNKGKSIVPDTGTNTELFTRGKNQITIREQDLSIQLTKQDSEVNVLHTFGYPTVASKGLDPNASGQVYNRSNSTEFNAPIFSNTNVSYTCKTPAALSNVSTDKSNFIHVPDTMRSLPICTEITARSLPICTDFTDSIQIQDIADAATNLSVQDEDISPFKANTIQASTWPLPSASQKVCNLSPSNKNDSYSRRINAGVSASPIRDVRLLTEEKDDAVQTIKGRADDSVSCKAFNASPIRPVRLLTEEKDDAVQTIKGSADDFVSCKAFNTQASTRTLSSASQKVCILPPSNKIETFGRNNDTGFSDFHNCSVRSCPLYPDIDGDLKALPSKADTEQQKIPIIQLSNTYSANIREPPKVSPEVTRSDDIHSNFQSGSNNSKADIVLSNMDTIMIDAGDQSSIRRKVQCHGKIIHQARNLSVHQTSGHADILSDITNQSSSIPILSAKGKRQNEDAQMLYDTDGTITNISNQRENKMNFVKKLKVATAIEQLPLDK